MTVIPTLRYDDPRAAIAFLVDALGFTEEHVTTDGEGRVAHAELSLGAGAAAGVVMLGTRRGGTGPDEDPFDTGRAVTYLVVDDPDAAHARAVAAGARVLHGLVDQPYGSREFAVADPEGNVWSVGTYRPQVRP